MLLPMGSRTRICRVGRQELAQEPDERDCWNANALEACLRKITRNNIMKTQTEKLRDLVIKWNDRANRLGSCRTIDEAVAREWLCSEELEHILDESSWQPMDTAPKDGSEILVTLTGGSVHMAWMNTRYNAWSIQETIGVEPLAWMPLPAPYVP